MGCGGVPELTRRVSIARAPKVPAMPRRRGSGDFLQRVATGTEFDPNLERIGAWEIESSTHPVKSEAR